MIKYPCGGPEIKLGDITGNKASVDQILHNREVVSKIICQLKLPEASFRIICFSVTLVIGSKLSSIYIDGAQIPQSVLDQIETMRAGDTIFIDDIKVLDPYSRIRTAPTITIQIQ